MTPGPAEMLHIVAEQVGYRQRSDGSTRYGDWFAGRHGATYRTGDWCAMGLLWCADRAGQLAAVGGDRKEWAWVPSWRDWFRQHGHYVHTPAPGRVVFVDWNANGVPNHVGIVESVDDRGIHTIEFNTDNACRRRTRPAALILGYGDPDYGADIELHRVVQLGAWIPQAWSHDRGLADGSVQVATALGSGYGHMRATHDGIGQLRRLVEQRQQTIGRLVDAVDASAADRTALRQVIDDALASVDARVETGGT